MSLARLSLYVAGAAVLVATVVAMPGAPHGDSFVANRSEDVTSVSTPMSVAGYDEEVAEANGFRIVTDADGVKSSVPVTHEARATVDKAKNRDRDVAPFDTVAGDCGQSWLNGSKGPNNIVSFTTGYSVRLPVQFHQWRVEANGFIASGQRNYAQGTGPDVWSVSESTTAVGPGIAIVPHLSPAAMVKLIDGATCYSGGPSFSFG